MLFDTLHRCIVAGVLSTVWHGVQLQGISCPPPGNTPGLGNGQWKTSSTNGKCYGGLPKTMLSFGDAEHWCRQHHSSLAMPKTSEDVTAVANAAVSILDSGGVSSITPPDIWIGLDDIEYETVWKWADGRKLTDSQSRFGDNLDNVQDEQHCAKMYVPGDINEWDDDICWTLAPFLCETDKYYEESRCPPGWTYFDCGEYCYVQNYKMATFYQQRDPDLCKRQNGTLAMPKTHRQYRAVMMMIKNREQIFRTEAWIGLKRSKYHPMDSEWDDGNVASTWYFKVDRWSQGRADLCYTMNVEGHLHARDCDTKAKYVVCQKPQVSPDRQNSLGCGLTWGQERLKNGLKRDVSSNVKKEMFRPLPNIDSNDTQQDWFKTNSHAREKNEQPTLQTLNLGNIVRSSDRLPIEYAPWAVRISIGQKIHCGGVLISPRYVLTAAHCVSDYKNGVRFDKTDVQVRIGVESKDWRIGRLEHVHNLKAHPDYRSIDGACSADRCNYDFAIIELKRSIQIDCWNTRAVLLPKMNISDHSNYKEFSKCFVVGWGRGSGAHLQHCNRMDKHIYNEGWWRIKASFYPCDIRRGDSGSPLMCRKNDVTDPWTLVGVIQTSGDDVGLAKVNRFIDWVRNNTQDTYIYNETVCETRMLDISCNYGRPPAIRILHAFWGRDSHWICRNTHGMHVGCGWEATQTLKAKCEGKHRCRFEANEHVFGRPCPGINKYLTFSYQCVHVEYHRQVVCFHNSNLDISCGKDNGLVISIVAANYGRYETGHGMCSNIKWDGRWCHGDIKSGIVPRCEGLIRCRRQMSYHYFSNPCPGVLKYYDIVYKCVPAFTNTSTVVLCDDGALDDGKHLDISCAKFEGTTIYIVSGFHGRKSDSICPTQYARDLYCGHDITPYVLEKCDGKVSCKTLLSTQIVGDPCIGLNKYFEVVYRCLSNPPKRPDTCPSGFEPHGDDLCYKFVNQEISHGGALSACKAMNAFLAEPKSAEENDFIKSIIHRQGENSMRSVWLGATDKKKEGEFVWQHKGDNVVWTDWMTGQPNNWKNQDCLEYKTTSERWTDKRCQKRQRYICQTSPGPRHRAGRRRSNAGQPSRESWVFVAEILFSTWYTELLHYPLSWISEAITYLHLVYCKKTWD